MAFLYKIFNNVNELVYYGIVYAKNKTVARRFEEHMSGKGGRLLYRHGVAILGRDCFDFVVLEEGPLDYIREQEIKLNKNNLWPTGYNGNTAHAIVVSAEQHVIITEKRKQFWIDNPDKKPRPPSMKGRKRKPEGIAKFKATRTGHTVSPETREKIRLARLGSKASPDTKAKMSATHQRKANESKRT